MSSNKHQQIQDKAKALLTLKSALGPHYQEQKDSILNEIVRLPLTEAAEQLDLLSKIGFIEVSELVGVR